MKIIDILVDVRDDVVSIDKAEEQIKVLIVDIVDAATDINSLDAREMYVYILDELSKV